MLLPRATRKAIAAAIRLLAHELEHTTPARLTAAPQYLAASTASRPRDIFWCALAQCPKPPSDVEALAASDAPSTSQQGLPADAEARRQLLVRRLLYRSKQRGFLEMDLLLGLWAEANLHRLSEPVLWDVSALLDLENPDLYKWLTGQAAPPQELLANKAYQMMSEHVARQLGQNRHLLTRAPPGAEWVRGWTDSDSLKPPPAEPQKEA